MLTKSGNHSCGPSLGENSEMETTPAKKIQELFVEGSEIDCALQRAVRRALVEHKRAGNPIVEWRDGKTFWLHPQDIPEDEELPESA